ncbi:MAG TPA: undecaprenyl-diphosphate phosphatase [Candidatus Saccharimonadales bacterium]|nr:undecaprenyl-diphosphate phosphatase [Candidatus Saccharimonadales bacterium]
MISVFQAVVIGLIQGITELFPVSSLGHSVILPSVFGWNLHQNDPYYLTFLVATHFATALILFIFFFKDWVKIIKGLGRSLLDRSIGRNDTYAKIGWLLVVATIPAGILGLLFQDSLQKLFASAEIASAFLIVNGFVLLAAERFRKRKVGRTRETLGSDENISKLSWVRSVKIGVVQSFALLPGISRSGSSMAAGLIFGLNNEEAARFSFLLATPVIGAAAVLKLPSLFDSSMAPLRGAIIAGAISAAVAAYISVRFLMRYFRANTLKPFAIYCLVAGISFLTYLKLK